jgi:3-phosphoshikimate 1-carboxyvinyltransferase
MIDEIPLLALVATQARGITVISDLEELRIKETDRLATTVFELKKLGVRVESRSRGLVIHGPNPLMGTDVFGHGDHRIAMMLMVAGLLARGETRVHGVEVTGDSFPGYEDTLVQLGAVLG